jgi:hypothetical protein
LDRYGIYFFVQRIRIVDDTVLLQLHYYKSFYHNKFISGLPERDQVLGGQIAWHAATQVSLMNPNELASAVKQSAAELSTLKYFGSRALFARSAKFGTSQKVAKAQRLGAANPAKLQQMLPGIKLFFNQFFTTFLGYRSVVLAKPLYQTFYLNPLLKAEFEKLLLTTKYLRKHE